MSNEKLRYEDSQKLNEGINRLNKSLKMKACSKVNGDNYSPKAESENED